MSTSDEVPTGTSTDEVETTAAAAGSLGSGHIAPRSLVRYALGLLILVLLLGVVTRLLRPPALHGVVLQSPERALDFSLEASTGQDAALVDFRDKVVLLYFGYSYCPDVCPTTLNDLAMAMEQLGNKARDVQVLMVTIDPERDSAEHLAGYLAHFHSDFIGLTGSDEEIEAVATRFGVFFEEVEGSEASGYLVDHTNAITLIDKDGFVRERFPGNVTGEELAADISYWMRN